MDLDEPLNRLELAAASVADDLGFVALADIAGLVTDTADWRLIGGHMVQIHAYRWRLGADLYRETLDADLGAPPLTITNHRIAERLAEIGYVRKAGDRFERPVNDVPAGINPNTQRRAVVDVLIPAYTSHARSDRRVGDTGITAIEVQGLATALLRSPVVVELALTRLNGQRLETTTMIPDEASALILKAFAWQRRSAPKDAVAIWRCLEIAQRAGVRHSDFDRDPEAAKIIRGAFDERNARAVTAIQTQRGLSDGASTQLATRIRALISQVVAER